MRRLLVGLVVAAATVLAPIWALAGNQEVAEQIAAGLRQSGQLRGYKIGVKYQDGTAWLRGHVSSQEQMNSALSVVSQTPGVSRVINHLTVGSGEQATASRPRTGGEFCGAPTQATPPSRGQPLRQVAGAIAPERLPRSVSANSGVATSKPAGIGSQVMSRLRQIGAGVIGGNVNGASAAPAAPATPQMPRHADRVATSFTPTPVRPVAATALGQPTLAETTLDSAPQIVPQPAAPQPAMPQAVMPQPAMPQPAMPQMAMAVPGQGGLIPRMAPPIPVAYIQAPGPMPGMPGNGGPIPQYVSPVGGGVPAARYDQPHLPNYAWPSYAAYPNYGALTYPKQYSPTAWPYIGPFYPYPQVPLGWRKVTLEWHDGWWQLDFDDGSRKGPFSGLFRPCK